jgi:uncharacterized phage infection (PIP) family protein YhgE
VAVTLVIVVTALGVAGCGESKEQKAQKAVCSARADIHKSITSLQGLTATTATVDGIKNDVTSIQTSLQTIRDNQDELSSARKAKVTAGAQQFAQQLQTIASGLTSNLSLANASAQVKSAAANLQSAFAAALAPIDCS